MGAAAAFVGKMVAKVKEAEKNAPKDAAEAMQPEIKKAVQEGINWWYAAYNPTYYVRTGGLNHGSMAGLTQSFGGNTLTVTVDSSHVPQHSHDSGDYVFNGGFVQGIHGTSQIAVTVPPWVMYEEKFEEIADKYLQKAVDKYLAEMP